MNDDGSKTLGWRGKLRMAVLRITRDPILSSRIDGIELRLSIVEQTLARLARSWDIAAIEVQVPAAAIGDAGRAQLIEQRLEALQARVDALTLSLAECRADRA